MSTHSRATKYYRFLAYVVVVVLLNLAGSTLFFRLDLTENGIYSLSRASRQVVSTLSEPLTVDVFFTRNLPAPYNNIEQYLHDLLQEYSIYGGNRFNYRFYDVSTPSGNPGETTGKNQEMAEGYGIYPVQVQNIEQDEVKFQKAYMGMVLIHGDLIEKIPTITSTEGLEYRITMAIRKLNNKVSAMLGLQNPIRIKLILSSSLQTVAPYLRMENLNQVPDQLKTVVERLNQRNYGKLQFSYLDPTTSPEAGREAEKYNLLSLRWPDLPNPSGNVIPAGQGYAGLVMEYGRKNLEIPLIKVLRVPLIGTQYQLVAMKNLESAINENVDNLVNINPELGYLSDHGTLSLSGGMPPGMGQSGRQPDALSNFRSLVSQGYSIKDIKLGTDGIPAGIDCLVVARPTEPFTDYELFQIDQFLMQGKSLAVFMDPFNEINPANQRNAMFNSNQGPVYVPVNTGLGKLLTHYGAKVDKAYVLDEDCYTQRIAAQYGGGERPIYFAPLIRNANINHDPPFMRNIKELIMLKIAPLSLSRERLDKQQGVTATRLFSSSKRSWDMSGRINLNPFFIQPPKETDKLKSRPLAYLLEGPFSSYFAGKPIPEKETKAEAGQKDSATDQPAKEPASTATGTERIREQGAVITRGKPGRIFLIGSADILRNNLLDTEGRSTNALFVMNVIDHLNGRDDIARMRGKEQELNPLQKTSPETKTMVKAINIAGVPILVVLFGILVWIRRSARKKRIQLMFQR